MVGRAPQTRSPLAPPLRPAQYRCPYYLQAYLLEAALLAPLALFSFWLPTAEQLRFDLALRRGGAPPAAAAASAAGGGALHAAGVAWRQHCASPEMGAARRYLSKEALLRVELS